MIDRAGIEHAEAKGPGPIGASVNRIEEGLGRAEHQAEMLASALVPVLTPQTGADAPLQAVPSAGTAPLADHLDRLGYRLEALGDLLSDLRSRVAL